MKIMLVFACFFAATAAAAPPDPTVVSSGDVDWVSGSYPGVTIKQFPGELGRMNLVRYAAGAVFPAHSHVNEQILMVQSGNYRVEVDGENYFLETGDVIIIPSYSVHVLEALVESSHVEFFAPTDMKPRAAN